MKKMGALLLVLLIAALLLFGCTSKTETPTGDTDNTNGDTNGKTPVTDVTKPQVGSQSASIKQLQELSSQVNDSSNAANSIDTTTSLTAGVE
jgi:PBP1b-binding outer membrane lipoprotein LpoB